jgi:4-amino-4-deoxy-L-arabinose transferase-like glycosyltransferase
MTETQPSDSVEPDKAPEEASVAKAPAEQPDAVKAEPPGGAANGGAALPAVDAAVDVKPRAPLLKKGNPLRLVRGGVTALVGSLFALTLMAESGQLRWGVPAGALFVLVAAWGVMDLFGTFDDPAESVAASTTLDALAKPLAGLLATSLLFCASLGSAAAGRLLPQPVWGVLVMLTFIAVTAAVFQLAQALGAWKVDEEGLDRPLWKRHGFWVIVAAAALYLPFMGTSSLWDPWETHYGEVAREMLSRDDWISLWWAQDGWFWSKPVLDMWMQAIAMATLGVHYQPDKMLVGNGTLPLMHPEWAVRAPVVLLTIVSMYLIYKGVAKTFGRRAALLGSLVLATMPDWYFLAHQTMTDMPCVAPMTACMGLVLLGLRTPTDATTRSYEVRASGLLRFRLSAWHLVFGAILVCALPQILYLISRNVEFNWRAGGHGFRWHFDEFRSGSGGGDCSLPGNEACHAASPASIPHGMPANPESFGQGLVRLFGAFEPVIQGLMWAGLLALALYLSWGERRVRRLLYLAAWFFAALATLGKGPEGVGLPVLVTLAYLAASRPGEDLLTRFVRIIRELAEFEIIAGLLVILAVAMPWYVAMYVRHGAPFTDRLIFHDMFNRAFSHVHDTNEGDDTSFRFYVWQLGYALFPWTGLAPLGLLWWLRRTDDEGGERTGKADVSVLLFMWFLFAFALFSFMGTKFHHYIFPAIPPVAMLIGIVLDDLLGRPAPVAAGQGTGGPVKVAFLERWPLPAYLLGLFVGVSLLVFGIARTQPGSFFGTKPDGHLAEPSMALAAVLAFAGGAIVVFFAGWFRGDPIASGDEPDDESPAHVSRMLAGGAVAAALLLIVVGRDLIIKPDGSDQPGAIRLLQLFTYNYRRAWPDALDFSAPLAAFTAVAVALSLALAVRPIRRHAVVLMCVFAFAWGIWGLDVYMQRTAQHWGQHEVIAAYYADRSSPEEQLVAYQMNWKGENFYTGNHVPAFVSTGSTFTTWLKKQRDAGTKVMYFITEHGRIGGLKSEVAGKNVREVTDKVLCNKFVLVRIEL